MAQESTVQAMAEIVVGPNGITVTFAGLDTSLANLFAEASTFTAQTPVYETLTTSVLTIQSDKKITFA